MAKGNFATRINHWCLRTSPEVVRVLAVDLDSPRRLIVTGRKNPLGFEQLLFLVPPEVEVYDPFRYNSGQPEKNVFFAVRPGDNEPAYAFIVSRRRGASKYLQNCETLLDWPWYDTKDTAVIYVRLAEKRFNNLLVGRFRNTHEENHPLAP